MESESIPPFRNPLPVIRWADLPPELLSATSGDLQNPTDFSRFRSVCRSWRSSTSPPPSPNKISPLFPLRVPSFCLQSESECLLISEKKYLVGGAVYLVSPRADPSKSWILSVQESTPGNLLLRHALTHDKIPGSSGNSIDLSEWTLTPIAMSYSFRFSREYDIRFIMYTGFCQFCDCLIGHAKAVFVEDTVVYSFGPGPCMRLCALSVDGTGASQYVDVYADYADETFEHSEIEDFVNFNGRIYAVDREGDVFVFDSANAQLVQMECGDEEYLYGKRLVVSDGDFYMVLKLCVNFPEAAECRVYKLVMDESGVKCCSYERVEDLGDRVFFISRDCCFSLSVQDLPGSFQGNCVVVGRGAFPECKCFLKGQELEVYDLGAGGKPLEFGVMSLWQDYSALFTPSSQWINQLRSVH